MRKLHTLIHGVLPKAKLQAIRRSRIARRRKHIQRTAQLLPPQTNGKRSWRSRAIQLDPAFAAAYSGRGLQYYSRREWDRAITDFTQAVRYDPKNAIAYNNRGAAYNNKSDWDRAIADFTEAIRIIHF